MVSLATHSPETMKDPDINSPPFFFCTSSASPVRRDSLTETTPSRISASAGISLPALKITISSKTNSCTGTFCSVPSRIAEASRADVIVNFSKVFLERISWTTPIKVFARITGTNVRLRISPTSNKIIASPAKTALK